jgi:hypothetical protein
MNSPYKLASVFVYNVNHNSDAMRKFLQVKNNRVSPLNRGNYGTSGRFLEDPGTICPRVRAVRSQSINSYFVSLFLLIWANKAVSHDLVATRKSHQFVGHFK